MAPALGAAGIGKVAEKGGEGLHLRGAEHDFGTSDLIRGRKNGLRQQGASVGPQGLEEDPLGGLRQGAVPPAGAAESLRVPHVDPVRRPIHRPAKTLRVHKGPQQQHAMTEGGLPIARQTPWAERQNPRPQIENMPVGQDEKAAVVDHQLQAAVALAKVPADPAIARRTLEGRGRKAQQRHPFLPPGGDIPQRFADLRQGPQVMMLFHQLLVTWLVAGTKGPDNGLTQVQGRISLRSTPPSFPVLPRGTIQRPGGFVQNKLQPLKTYTAWAPGRIYPGRAARSRNG